MSSLTETMMSGWQTWMGYFGGDPVMASGSALVLLIFAAGVVRLWSAED